MGGEPQAPMAHLLRRGFLSRFGLTAAALLAPDTHLRAKGSRVIAGAIRWDAWYRPTDYSAYAQNDLGPKKYQYRAPRHCKVVSDDAINCVGGQETLDAEIVIAAETGLDFWAFVWYGPNSSFRVAWNLYQSSRFKGQINWCGILSTDLFGPPPFGNGNWRETIREWAAYMAEPSYQKVGAQGIQSRPLLFVLWQSQDLTTFFDGKLTNFNLAVKYLNELVSTSGLGAPYIVLLAGVKGAEIAEQVGADAISNYISGFRSEISAPYASLDRQTRAYWSKLASTGAPIVPIAMVGWDTRARREHLGPWHHAEGLDRYYKLPTPQELAAHVKAGVDYISTHPATCPSKVFLIYSWDECDEGGGLIPTLGDPAGTYLSAIKPIFK